MTLYLAVSPDELELPMAVAGSKAELARMLHLSMQALWHREKTSKKIPECSPRGPCERASRIRCVEITEDEP